MNFVFIKTKVSTTKPIVGVVVLTCPRLIMFRIVDLPPPSSPSIKMRTSSLARPTVFLTSCIAWEMELPMSVCLLVVQRQLNLWMWEREREREREREGERERQTETDRQNRQTDREHEQYLDDFQRMIRHVEQILAHFARNSRGDVCLFIRGILLLQ